MMTKVQIRITIKKWYDNVDNEIGKKKKEVIMIVQTIIITKLFVITIMTIV